MTKFVKLADHIVLKAMSDVNLIFFDMKKMLSLITIHWGNSTEQNSKVVELLSSIVVLPNFIVDFGL